MIRFAIAPVAAAALAALVMLPAQAAPVTLNATLSGAAENPPNASPATGSAQVTFDDVANTMRVWASFTGLTGTTTAAHIHCCIAAPGNVGVATRTPSFLGFPLTVTAGSMDDTYDMTLASSFRAGFITDNGGTVAGARAALFNGMLAGRSYFNIHTTTFGGGEIRGFLVSAPATYTLVGLPLAALAFMTRRRKRRSGFCQPR